MWRHLKVSALLLLLLTHVPAQRSESFVPPNTFKAADIEPVPEDEDYFQWYCDDPREPAKVLRVVFDEGTKHEYSLYDDPDLCDSELARSGR